MLIRSDNCLQLIVGLILTAVRCQASCDIFLLGECSQQSAAGSLPSSLNSTDASKSAYCTQVKKRVECVNKKLKECSLMSEYASALETVKLNLIFEISSVTL